MNRVELIGFISTDLILDETESKIPYTRFQLGVKDKGATDFISIIAWRGVAKAIVTHVKKGDMIGISGKVKVSRYENKEGTMVYQTDIKTELATFIGAFKTKQIVELPETDANKKENTNVNVYDNDNEDPIKF